MKPNQFTAYLDSSLSVAVFGISNNSNVCALELKRKLFDPHGCPQIISQRMSKLKKAA